MVYPAHQPYLLAICVFLVPSIIDLFRDESSVAFGQSEEEETEDSEIYWMVI